MGASESDSLREELTEYRVTDKDIKNNITHLSHIETENEYLLHELTFNDEELYRRSYEEHMKRSKLPSDHLTHATRVQGKEIDHLCSNLYKLYSIWEYPMRFLSEEIRERALQKRNFESRELWSILASCIYAMSTLQQNKIKHQCLSTQLILLDNFGIVKVADPLATGAIKNFEVVYKNRNANNIYLSPQQCALLQTRGGYSNSYKNDIWSMGMILLECGLLESQSRCYRNNNQKVDYIQIKASLRRFSEQYQEQQFTNILQIMLKPDEKDRPDWVGLKQLTNRSTNSSRQHDATKQPHHARNTHSSMTKHQRPVSFHHPTTFYSRSPAPKPMHGYSATQQFPVRDFSSQQQKPIPNNEPSPSMTSMPKPELFQPELQGLLTEKRNVRPLTQYHSVRDSSPIIPGRNPNSVLREKKLLGAYPVGFGAQSAADRQLPLAYHNQQTGYLFGRWQKPNQPPQYAQQFQQYTEYPRYTSMQYEQSVNINSLNSHPSTQNRQAPPPALQSNPTSIPKLTFSTNHQESYQETLGPGRITSSNHQYSVDNQNDSESVLRSRSKELPSIEAKQSKCNSQRQSKQEDTDQHQHLEYVVETFKQGSRYEGFKLSQMRHGQGKFFYQDGGKYDGEWKMNQMDGYGALYYQSGKLAYEGWWVKDHFSGKGKLYNQLPYKSEALFDYSNFDQIEDLWQSYEGDFSEDFKQGNGKLFLSNGQYFDGTFSNDMVEGIGEYHRKNGQIIKGRWIQNQLVQEL